MTRRTIFLVRLVLMLAAALGVAGAASADPPPECAAVNYAFGMNLGYTMYGFEYAARGGVSPTPDQLAALQRGNVQLAAMADSMRAWKADRAVSQCPLAQLPDAATLIELSLFPPTTAADAASVLARLTGIARQVGLALKSPAGVAAGAAAAAGVAVVSGTPDSWQAGGLLGALIGGQAAHAAGRVLAPDRTDPATAIIGTWNWFNGAVVTVGPGGSLKSSFGFSGTWQCTDPVRRTFAFNWTQGPTGPWYDKVTLSGDGWSLTGENQDHTPISATKAK